MINKRKFFLSFFILLCIFSHAIKATFAKSKQDSCCQVIQVQSTGPLLEFYPEHIGSYKRLRSRRRSDDYNIVYKHMSNAHSFIFLQGTVFENHPKGRVVPILQQNSEVSLKPRKIVRVLCIKYGEFWINPKANFEYVKLSC